MSFVRKNAPMTPLFIRALQNEIVERPPVWLMRQAGRYMSEYRALKEKYTFLELCRSPELAKEVTMQPINAFDMDAAIVFSDILIPAEALGFEVDFAPGPVVANKISTASDISKLKKANLEGQFDFLSTTLKDLKTELSPKDKALIGFAGAPWTLACYLIDQGPFKQFQGSSIFLHKEPEAFKELLDILAELIANYLKLQIKAGADAVQIFDSWAGNLSLQQFTEFSLPVLNKILSKLESESTPTIVYLGNASHLLPCLNQLNCNCLSLDHRISLKDCSSELSDQFVLQGNIDPSLLFADKASVQAGTRDLISTWPKKNGLIVNLGHGVLQKTPIENVAALVEEVKSGWGNV